MGLDIMHVNDDVLKENTKKVSDSFKDNNASEWFIEAFEIALTGSKEQWNEVVGQNTDIN